MVGCPGRVVASKCHQEQLRAEANKRDERQEAANCHDEIVVDRRIWARCEPGDTERGDTEHEFDRKDDSLADLAAGAT